MRRLLLSTSLVFMFAGMCGGGGEEAAPEEDPVVVPVPTADAEGKEGEDGENWCCEYKDTEGAKQYALTEGPAECNTKYADQDGRWISGSQCIPCCCKTANDPEDAEKGDSFELTTPKSCSGASGECLAGDAAECSDGEEEVAEDKEQAKPRPRPKPRPTTVTKPKK